MIFEKTEYAKDARLYYKDPRTGNKIFSNGPHIKGLQYFKCTTRRQRILELSLKALKSIVKISSTKILDEDINLDEFSSLTKLAETEFLVTGFSSLDIVCLNERHYVSPFNLEKIRDLNESKYTEILHKFKIGDIVKMTRQAEPFEFDCPIIHPPEFRDNFFVVTSTNNSELVVNHEEAMNPGVLEKVGKQICFPDVCSRKNIREGSFVVLNKLSEDSESFVSIRHIPKNVVGKRSQVRYINETYIQVRCGNETFYPNPEDLELCEEQ